MNGLIKTAMAGILLAGLMGIASAQDADPNETAAKLRDDVTRLQRDIQHADADLQRTDSLSRDEAAAAAQNADRWQKDRERHEKENQELNARVQETRAKITAEQTRMQGYLNAADEIKAREKSLLTLLSGFADSLLARVQAGPPWDLETRRDRLLSLKSDIEAGSAGPDEVFGRLAAILKDEIKNGDEVAEYNRPLTRQNGEVINAQMLKLGNQSVVYMDDEGKKFGVLERRIENGKPVYAWREALDFKEQNSVKLALAVKAEREAPQLVPLDVSLSPDSASVTASANGGR